MTTALAVLETADDAAPRPCVLPADTWLIAAHAEELGTAPVGRIVNGLPIVLYRTADGRVAALEDRCPHKNVPLSIGRVVGDTIQCRFHGWRIAADGTVADVPCHSPNEQLPRCVVPAPAVVEQDGWLWMNLAGTRATGAPPLYERTPGYHWFEIRSVVDAPLDLVLEIGLDCSHTCFAHEGVFRSAPTQFATAQIEETPTGVRVTTEEGAAVVGRDPRSTLGRGKAIRHVDEIILPHTVKVDYHMGERLHMVTILACTPESAGRTRIFTRVGVCAGRLTPLVGRYVHWLTRQVVRQDNEVLEHQAACIRRFGGRDFRLVVADQPATWMQRVRRLHARGVASGAAQPRTIQYRL
jgi:phenylpropionate dioxygenase-like ring-hydroxylating dioxygenase large terminal subunit